ncbi:DUF885 domain-containing protein [Asticcacaulis excentricus]|uniref:DUF885 family protein n=1 Tax=Asticcacaulis excentricus (strain ATCC 15261 / DSM 4724 / KCTC 12464 / NCIMB 9791 / VKM B-1370 / CB 48) TaxID=573065 RepID=E8RNQ0_ASTEC|nr:DUF885 family protein [Asticcacaulis excentricus]ADU12946.1 protein of unknown function DUF885 [Asticcacaulis excentricus CB 48]
MKALLRATALSVILVSSALPVWAEVDPAVQAKFETIYKTEWEWRGKQSAANEDTPADQRTGGLPDVSKAAQDKKLAYWQNVLKELDAIDTSKLSEKDADNYRVYRFQIETLINGQVYKLYERPLAGDTSFWADLNYIASGTLRTEADYRNYIKTLGDMPRYFGQNIDNMRSGLKRGFTLPRVSLQGRDVSLTQVIEAKGEANPFYKPFKHFPATIAADKQAELKKLGLEAIQKSVIPAHQNVLTFLNGEYTPKATTSIAAIDLPDGRNFYQAQIYEYTTLTLTPDQIHQIGLDEVAKIRGEMDAVMKEVGFKGDLKAFLTFLRTDQQFYAKTPQELLDRSAWAAKMFDGKAGDYFGRLPRMRFAIIPVAPEIAPFYTSGRGGPGGYWVNTYNLPSRPLYSVMALTLHESAPGHAFQMPLAMENKGLPPFRQSGYISAYGEGWALYSERLGVEMGMYQTPYERFGMLSYQMWRAARLVVDTGMHAKGWTRDQALTFLRENTALSEHEITTEVDRYIAWPGQALSYYLGEMAIWKTRAKAEAALGEKFDIRAFHDTVLELGSVPLPVMEQAVDRFIARGGTSPYKDEN